MLTTHTHSRLLEDRQRDRQAFQTQKRKDRRRGERQIHLPHITRLLALQASGRPWEAVGGQWDGGSHRPQYRKAGRPWDGGSHRPQYRKASDLWLTYPGQGRLFRGGMRGEATRPLGLCQTGQTTHEWHPFLWPVINPSVPIQDLPAPLLSFLGLAPTDYLPCFLLPAEL